MEYKEYLVTPEKTVIREKNASDEEFLNGQTLLSSGESSFSGFKNIYFQVDNETRQKYKSVVRFLPNVVDTVCKQINEETGEERLKGYSVSDFYNLQSTLGLPENDVRVTSFYFEGPKNIIDFYFSTDDYEGYENWLNNYGFRMLELPENAFQYFFSIRYDTETKKVLTHKRYGTSIKIDIDKVFEYHFLNPRYKIFVGRQG